MSREKAKGGASRGSTRTRDRLDPISLSITRSSEGGVVVALRYSYEKKPPSPKKRLCMAKAMLRETLDRLERGEPAQVGFSEDVQRRVRTDWMEL